MIYVKGWSEGEPIKSVEKGTFDVLELWVNVSIRSIGNIVFEICDQNENILPGDCAYEIDVIKEYEPGYWFSPHQVLQKLSLMKLTFLHGDKTTGRSHLVL